MVTLIAELSRVNVKLSSSSYLLRFFGNNFDRLKNSPLWISFTYDAGMSWFGTEIAGSCGDSVLSQSGFGSPGEVVCLGGSVAPFGFVSLCGVVPKLQSFGSVEQSRRHELLQWRYRGLTRKPCLLSWFSAFPVDPQRRAASYQRCVGCYLY